MWTVHNRLDGLKWGWEETQSSLDREGWWIEEEMKKSKHAQSPNLKKNTITRSTKERQHKLKGPCILSPFSGSVVQGRYRSYGQDTQGGWGPHKGLFTSQEQGCLQKHGTPVACGVSEQRQLDKELE